MISSESLNKCTADATITHGRAISGENVSPGRQRLLWSSVVGSTSGAWEDGPTTEASYAAYVPRLSGSPFVV